jgi:hypothetical protein
MSFWSKLFSRNSKTKKLADAAGRPDQPQPIEPIEGKKITTVKPSNSDLQYIYSKELLMQEYSNKYEKEKLMTYERSSPLLDYMGESYDQGAVNLLKELLAKQKGNPPEDPTELPTNPFCQSINVPNPGDPVAVESIDYVSVFGATEVYEIMDYDELRIVAITDAHERTPLQFWNKTDREGKKPGQTTSKRLIYIGVAPVHSECERLHEKGKNAFVPMYRVATGGLDKCDGLVSLIRNIATSLTFAGREVLIPQLLPATVAGEEPVRTWRVFSPTREIGRMFAYDFNLLEGQFAQEAVQAVASGEIQEQSAWYDKCRKYEEYHQNIEYLDSISESEFLRILGEYDPKTRRYASGITDEEIMSSISKWRTRPPGHPGSPTINPCAEIPLGAWEEHKLQVEKQVRRSAMLNQPIMTASQKNKDVPSGAFMMKNQ